MEEEGGVKAPVTRLRRRLSVELSDDAKPSSAPNTPTKKRGGRRAAKPELDLIDENAPENDIPKKVTKKANMKDLEVEEKPITPSRRSARIKSNTSLVLETTQSVESPRAKRALRRLSQTGSDNEAPLTPARGTRRTRKDSAQSDKADKPVAPITDIIVEEPETSLQKSQSNSEKPIEQSLLPSGLRKSPRLSSKKDKRSASTELNEKETDMTEKQSMNKHRNSIEFNEKDIDKSEKHNNSNKENEASQIKETPENDLPYIKLTDISNNIVDVENNRLSISNVELLNKLSTEPMTINKKLNKSSSALTETQTGCSKYQRHRTKSWTDLSKTAQNNNKYFSDSENTKKLKKTLSNKSNISDVQSMSKNTKDDLSTTMKRKSVCNTIKEIETDLVDSSNNERKLLSTPTNNPVNSSTSFFFHMEPTNDMKTLVYIEESDSNSEKINTHKSDHQCNDISQTHFNAQETTSKHNEIQSTLSSCQENEKNVTIEKNNSCEPMDIDETIPDNTISNKSLLAKDMSEIKVSSEENDEMNYTGKEQNKHRKSSLTLSTSQILDKTKNENKSTLVLSQFKDISNETSETQSPHIAIDTKLSNSSQVLNLTQDNEIGKKNISLIYSTSTPLQHKSLIKHAIQVNASGIVSNNTSKIDKNSSNSSKIHISNTNKSNNKSEQSETSDESSQEESHFLNDEAEEASDDYESGDSRDDEEEQYEREHEIIQKGVTLTSEDELSNDTDYEKDSFVVSSDQEDDDLLDGSGDDLSLNNNELEMTADSKKIYNERKMKEQKKASREMFESRHKLNVSRKSYKSVLTKIKKNRAVSSDSEDENIQVKTKKSKRMQLNSSQESITNESFENVPIKTKKNKKMQLDSSQESITNKSSENVQIKTKKNKKIDSSHVSVTNESLGNISTKEENKSLSKSLHSNSVTNEVEMTIINDDIESEIDPLSIEVKQEPETPQKGIINTSIQFIEPENLEKKDGDSNKSQLNMTVADDPLEESASSDSLDSGNNVHIQNYDSVLNDLNKSIKTIKNKKGDISLNTEKKPKQKSAPIVDQLNLTQVKSSKKKLNEVTLTDHKKSLNDKSKKNPSNKYSENETSLDKLILKNSTKPVAEKECSNEDSDNVSSSSSINIHLLFSEDSNNSEDVEIKHKEGKRNNEDDSFIPLKKSHGKTSIINTSGSNNKSNTESAKKMKMKNRSLDKSNIENEDNVDETEVKFFLDTTGTHNLRKDDKLLNSSLEKKTLDKQKDMAVDHEDSDSDAPMEVSNKSVLDAPEQQYDINKLVNTSLTALNKSKTKTPKSDKKTTRKESVNKEETDAADKSVNKSVSKTPKSDKKKAKRMSESKAGNQNDCNTSMEVSNRSVRGDQEQPVDVEEINNTSVTAPNKSINKTPKSDKKKKRTSESYTKDETDTAVNQLDVEEVFEAKEIQSGIGNKSINKSVSKTPKSEKKKAKRLSETETTEQKEEQVLAVEPIVMKSESTTKHEDILDTIEEPEDRTGAGDKSLNKSAAKTPKSDKKKKNTSESKEDINILNEVTNESDYVSFNSNDKEKSSKNIILEDSPANKILIKTKKKSKKISESENAMDGNVEDTKELVGSKKRKRKTCLNQTEREPISEELLPSSTSTTDTIVSIASTSQKKKRKISHYIEDSENLGEDHINNTKIGVMERQQNQDIKKQRHPLGSKTDTDVKLNNRNLTKKRKDRDEDEGNNMNKVLKVDANDKTRISRLPASVLNQLEDKPTKKTYQDTKRKAISTTSFVIEESNVKKIGPSNYLEESVYFNEDELLEPNKQKRFKNPKVLPFLPTVSTSNSGYTTNFKVNTLPKEFKFVAKSTNVNNYKDDYLQNKRMKRLGTYELYKRNRTVKMSKF